MSSQKTTLDGWFVPKAVETASYFQLDMPSVKQTGYNGKMFEKGKFVNAEVA